jgi:hypothetical protein
VRGGLALVVALVALAPLLGAPMLLSGLAAGLAWFPNLRSRSISFAMAFTTIVTGVLFSLLLVLVVTALVPVPPLAALCGFYALAAAAGILTTADRTVLFVPKPSAGGLLVVVAPFAGAAVWLAVRALSAFVPNATEIAWATINDGANSLLFGRQVIIDGGIRLGPGENPVPLTAAIVAAATMPGRSPAATAEHDVLAFVGAWSLLIVLVCISVGLLCQSLIQAGRRTVRILGPALTSLLPLSWIIGGLTIEYGYINVAPTLMLLAFATIAFVLAHRHAPMSLIVIVVVGMLLMTSWSPLTLIPVFLAAILIIRERSALWIARPSMKVAMVVTVLLAVVFAVAFVLPTFNASREAIESDVSFYPFRVRHVVVVLAAATILAVVLWWRRKDPVPLLALFAVAAGGGAAVAVFLYARRGEATLWAYYPYKALWFLLIMVLVLTTVFAVAVIGEFVHRAWAVIASMVLAGAATVAFGSWANTVPGYGSMNVVQRVLSGMILAENAGDSTWDRIFDLADDEPRGILWRSGDPNESFIDFWLVKLASPGFDDLELHVLAYTIDTSDVDDLCRFAEIVGPELQVETQDPALPHEVAACENPGLTVTVTR